MRPTFLSKDSNEPLNVLCLGAHCDDIEIGCGGTLLELLRTRSQVNVYWQVFTSTPSRREEAIQGAKRVCSGANSLEIDILDFRDGYLPYEGDAVKKACEETKTKFSPDLILTHYRSDLHQDHRKVSELTWNTFRDHLIWEYEIPKWDGDLGSPNVFVPLERSVAEKKISILQSVYNSQNNKKWFTDDLFLSILRIRGMECNSASGLAEGFYVRKNIVAFGD
jgi:LmbE family N-acetylglucosaminyl deacetylase